MDVSEFDYELPPERIAQRPLPERDASRLLLLDRASGAWEDRQFQELPEILRGNELMVVNNARVVPARLFGHRAGIHAQPLGRRNPARHEFLSAQIEGVARTSDFAGHLGDSRASRPKNIHRRANHIWRRGTESSSGGPRSFGLRVLRFTSKDGFHEALGRLGHIPLPPYIKRADEPLDRERYQTVFARRGIAVAAPTAGLHFTSRILDRIRARGVEVAELTLEVGLGTFEPVRTERLEEHKIHAESYEIPEGTVEAIAKARREDRPVLAVGTTVVRALEDSAEKNGGLPAAGKFEANIFLFPGKIFRVVNQMLTNFHLPRSTLLAMVAAFAGRENILRAYRHAVESRYRFYSYGDAMLIR